MRLPVGSILALLVSVSCSHADEISAVTYSLAMRGSDAAINKLVHPELKPQTFCVTESRCGSGCAMCSANRCYCSRCCRGGLRR
jgi:hypothetical protein